MREGLLSIGSVIALPDTDQSLMITGRLQICKETKAVFDYSAVLWPQGLEDSASVYLLNHEQIAGVLFQGYSNEQEHLLSCRLRELKAQLESGTEDRCWLDLPAA